MATIDDLNIQISSDVTKAVSSIDLLDAKLSVLSGSLSKLNGASLIAFSNGVKTLESAVRNFASIDTRTIGRVAKNINQLGSINYANLSSSSVAITSFASAVNGIGNVSGVSTQISNLVKSISKIGNASFTKAIAEMPKLSSALISFFNSMSKAPRVRQDTIDMANALAQLASQGSKVGSAARSLNSVSNNVSRSFNIQKNAVRTLSSAIGKLYQSYFWVTRIAKAAFSAIKASMDYIEVENYFNAAMEQVIGKADLSKWNELGYESAKDYANSFTQTLESLATKMTGYEVDSSGMLVQADTNKALGLNPTELMNYETQFAQMASSIGLTSDNAVKLSKVLTELGGDLASVKNMDFAQVWNNEASGILAGMSRAVDKYGINVRNTALQQELTNLGIETSVQNLSQQDKVLLRTIVTLKSSKYAWADLADTINQPANQIRLLQANFQNLSRNIGNIFLPVVASAIPIINELVYAMATLAEWIGKLLGFKGFDWGGQKGAPELVSDLNDADDAMQGATGSAKKLKQQLQGFDELNNLTSNKGGGSGKLTNADLLALQEAFDAAIREYQARWDKAFNDMSESAHRFAIDVSNAFKRGGLFGVGEYFSKSITNALNSIDWNKVKNGGRRFGEGLAKFLNGFVSPDMFGAVAKTVAELLSTKISAAFGFAKTFNFKNLGESLASAINNFFLHYDLPRLAETASMFAVGILNTISTALANTDWELIGIKLGLFLQRIDWFGVFKGVFSVIYNAIEGVMKTLDTSFALAPGATTLISLVIGGIGLNKVALPAYNALIRVFGKFSGIFATITIKAKSFISAFNAIKSTGGTVFASIASGFKGLAATFSPFVKAFGGIFTVITEFFALKDAFYNITKSSDNLGKSIGKVIATLTTSGLALTALFGFPAGTIAAGVVGLIGGITGINKAFNDLEAERTGDRLRSVFETPGGMSVDALSDKFISGVEDISSSFTVLESDMSNISNANESIQSVWKEIDQIQFSMDNGIISVEEGTAKLAALFDTLASIANEKFTALNSLLASSLGTDGALRQGLEETGLDAMAAYASALGINESAMKRVVEISQQLSEMSYGDEGYAELSAELAKLTGKVSETDKAVKTFNEDMDLTKIDWSKFMGTDGTVDFNQVNEFLAGITNSITTAQAAVKTGYDDLKAGLEESLAMADPSSEEYAQLTAAIEAIPNASAYWDSQFAEKAKAVTDALQTQLIDGAGGVITKAQEDFAKMSPVEKIKWKTEGNYVKNALTDWQNSVSGISSGIETSMKTLGIDGAGWATDASSNIVDSLFDTEKIGIGTKGQIGITTTKLKSDWKDILDGVAESAKDGGTSIGEYTSDGAVEGMARGGAGGSIDKASRTFGQTILDTIIEVLAIGSPSKKMYELGQFTTEGMSNGMMDMFNIEMLPNVYTMCDEMLSAFKEGLSGLNTVFEMALHNACNVAIDVFNTMLDAFNKSLTVDIDFTNPITKENTKFNGSLAQFGTIPKFSQGGFPEDGLFYANHNELVGGFNGRTAVANNDQIIDGIEAAVYRAFSDVMRSNNTETTVNVSLQGDADGIFKVVRESAQKYRKSTGNAAF